MSAASTAIERIRDSGLVPVIRADSAARAMAIAEALVEAGIRIIEITMTVPDAIAAMQALRKRLDAGVTLGGGTMTSAAMAHAAIDAGCEFLVTPCLVPDVIAAGRARHVPVICGALTPTEIFTAHASGAAMVKVFPIGTAGGPDYIRAIRGPLPHIPLMVTGGVGLDRLDAYFASGVEAIGVGGELVSKTAVAAGDFEAVKAQARRFVDGVHRARSR